MSLSIDRIRELGSRLADLGQNVAFPEANRYLSRHGLKQSTNPGLLWGVEPISSRRVRDLFAGFDILPEDMRPALSCGQWRETSVYGYPFFIATNAILDPVLKAPSADILQRKPGTRFRFGTEIHFSGQGRAGVFVRLPGEMRGYGRFIEGTPIWRLVEGKLTEVELNFAAAALAILSP